MLDLESLTDRQHRALNRYASAKRNRTEPNCEALRAATIHVIACGLRVSHAEEFAKAEAEFFTKQDPFAAEVQP